MEKASRIKKIHDNIIEVRGAGLLLGIKTQTNNLDFSKALKKNKLLNVIAGDNVVRFAPPLIISEEHIDEAIKIIDITLSTFDG